MAIYLTFRVFYWPWDFGEAVLRYPVDDFIIFVTYLGFVRWHYDLEEGKSPRLAVNFIRCHQRPRAPAWFMTGDIHLYQLAGLLFIYFLPWKNCLSPPPSFNISFFERKLLWGAEVCCRVCNWLVVPLGRRFLFYSHVLIYWVVYLYIRGSVLIYLYTHAYTHILTYINIYTPTHIYAHVDIQYVHAHTQ